MGERLLRELQWEAEGRMPEWGDLLLTAGGADRDRMVAGRVQHPATALGARLQAAGTVGLQPLGSTQSSFTAPGCDVDSQCAWYKSSVRSPLLTIDNFVCGFSVKAASSRDDIQIDLANGNIVEDTIDKETALVLGPHRISLIPWLQD